MFDTIRHLFHVYRIMHSSSTTEGILYDRMIYICGVSSDSFVCRCCKCCKKCCKCCKCLLQHLQHLQHFEQQSTTEYNRVENITAGARMRKSYARHVMATNLLTTTNKFPSAAMARVACLLANWVRRGPRT